MSDQIPRLSPEQMPTELAAMLAPRVKRLGYLGEFFQCTAHQPDALRSFLEFTEHLKHALPENLTEVVALSTAVVMDNSYERTQHERLILKLGYSQLWLAEVKSLGVHGYHHLSQQEQVVQRFVVRAAKHGGRDSASELDEVVQAIGPAQSVAVLMLAGRYVCHALIVNALELPPPSLPTARENGS